MAHNEFEHIVQGRFQGFESTPPEAVWTSINSARNRRKKRMIILWWVLPLTTAACLGMGIYVGTGNSNNSNTISTSTKGLKENTLKTEIQEYKNSKSTTENTSKSEENGGLSATSSDTNFPSQEPLKDSKKVKNPSKTTAHLKAPRTEEITQKPLKTGLSEDLKIPHGSGLTARPLQPLGIDGTSLNLCQAYGTGTYLNYNSHSIGIRMGGFFTLSQQKSTPNAFTLADPTTDPEPMYGSYARFIEVAPYYEFTKTTSRFRFQAFALYAASNMNLANYSGKSQSFGLGTGTSYALINKRFSTHLYANLQSEISLNSFSNNNETTSSGGGTATINASGDEFSSYRQFSLAGEAGIRFSYVLSRSRWSINASAGYRNYFWQQKIESPAATRTPDLLHWNAGIRFTL